MHQLQLADAQACLQGRAKNAIQVAQLVHALQTQQQVLHLISRLDLQMCIKA